MRRTLLSLPSYELAINPVGYKVGDPECHESASDDSRSQEVVEDALILNHGNSLNQKRRAGSGLDIRVRSVLVSANTVVVEVEAKWF